MKSVDLNCDMGESYGHFMVGNDQDIMPYLSSCNIACGFHGGDPLTIDRTIKLAIKYGVKIGAHPSYPDLPGFGRRAMKISPEELFTDIKYQIAAIKGIAESYGEELHHVKPHGALYNAACKDKAISQVIVDAICSIDKSLLIYGPAGISYKAMADHAGIKYIHEVFADRNYEEDLSLTSREEPQAIIKDIEISIEHILRMLNEGVVQTRTGSFKKITAETICIHGDQSGAAELAKRMNLRLKIDGFTIVAPDYAT